MNDLYDADRSPKMKADVYIVLVSREGIIDLTFLFFLKNYKNVKVESSDTNCRLHMNCRLEKK